MARPRRVDRLPRLADRLAVGSSGLEVSPFCLGMVRSADTVSAAFDAGINFFFLTGDMHWPLYEESRRGIELLLRRGGGVRDEIVVGAVSYVAQPEFSYDPFEEAMAAIPGLGRVDVLIAGGCYLHDLLGRLESLEAHKRSVFAGARAIGATFHDRRAARLAVGRELIDIGFLRYNARHTGARDDVFPFLPEGIDSLLFSFQSTAGYVAPDLLREQGLGDEYWRPRVTDHYRFALSRGEVDGLLCAPQTPREVDELAAALEEGPLDDEEEEYLVGLTEVADGAATVL